MSILGSGSALPGRILHSTEIDRRLDKPAGWTAQQVGVAARGVCEAEDQIDLATTAASEAMADAGCAPADIGLVISAAAVPYQSIPATAPLVQKRLGIPEGGCAAFDINATCLSFLTAMDLVASTLSGAAGRRCLVVSSEVASRALPWTSDPLVAALFGDDCRLGAGGTRYDFQRAPQEFARHALFEMDGRALFRHTLKFFEPFLARLLGDAGWRRDEVELVIPHQASPAALAHLVERCGFGTERVVDIMHDHGNQIAASIPTALDRARKSGRLKEGTRALMLGTSAGLSLGGIAFVA
jgi:3-oxoacyl-[acyl-carrier-protein] synthase-3